MITPLQRAAARLFFSLPESVGFAVAGGAALIARDLIDRGTRDVDLFTATPPTTSIPDATAAFERAATAQGWVTRRVQLSDSFARLVLEVDGEALVVDLGVDSPPDEPPTLTELGPTLTAHDLAARKTLALFGRAEARDFTDVHDLTNVFTKNELIRLARAQDDGFDLQVFADMIGTIGRFTDDDLHLPRPDADRLRHFFHTWRREIVAGKPRTTS
jgi:hypothetical protein